ncbi:ECF transporter S component [Microbacterium sp. RU33B]|uniref:ECF transporter S component n=1 Tax=Microbacterium sp. RU33B TaxID=1907390 RepID=UPI0009659A71|nr:ECF transporter S component [Microbacterium sp. RU33B]SIT72317.1 ABC-type cobalt transport system, permease component [Microbacterium sp. RU33B]
MRSTTTTRYLLSCAAIGAAGAVLLIPANNLAIALGTALPFLYAAMVGVWLLPSALAMALIRRPGAGVQHGEERQSRGSVHASVRDELLDGSPTHVRPGLRFDLRRARHRRRSTGPRRVGG